MKAGKQPKKGRGRPAGRKQSVVLKPLIDPETKDELARRAYEANISEAELARRLIREAAAGKRR